MNNTAESGQMSMSEPEVANITSSLDSRQKTNALRRLNGARIVYCGGDVRVQLHEHSFYRKETRLYSERHALSLPLPSPSLPLPLSFRLFSQLADDLELSAVRTTGPAKLFVK